MRLEMEVVGSGRGGKEGEDGPFVTATVKLWACDLLLELLPVCQPPSEHVEILDIMP